jgi:hypothetical protein
MRPTWVVSCNRKRVKFAAQIAADRVDVLRRLVHLASETFERRKAALDMHQSLGQGFVVAPGKAGQDQLARDTGEAPGYGQRPRLQLFDVARRQP